MNVSVSSSSKKVFIPDEVFVWLSAEVVSENIEMGQLEVVVQDEVMNSTELIKKTISLRKSGLAQLPLQNLNICEDGVEDMCSLGYLHEPSILENLIRFDFFLLFLFDLLHFFLIVQTIPKSKTLYLHR